MSCICGQSERILSNQMLISLYRHAEIFTTEEACRIAREKLVKLRTLYLNQYHRLGYVLRARRGESTWSQNARCIAASPISPGTNKPPYYNKCTFSMQQATHNAGSDREAGGLQNMWDREGRNQVSCQNGTSAHDL